MLMMKGEDGLFLVGREPMVARNPAVVLVHFAVTLFPVVELAGLNPQPSDDLFGRKASAVRPITNIVDHRVAGVVGPS
jgi:hypothetical protein